MIKKYIQKSKFKKNRVFLHPLAICESENIGSGTRIWAFTHILPNVLIGKNCNICDFVFIEDNVKIGNNVTIKSGVQVWKGVQIMDDVFVGPNVTFTNDKFPKSGDHSRPILFTIVEKGVSIGANSTILPGIRLGQFSVIGAGAVVTKDVSPFTHVKGVPAKIYKQKNQD